MQTIRIHNQEIPISVLQEYKSIQKLIIQSDFSYENFARLMEIHGQIIYGLHSDFSKKIKM
ncbi:MAG: hypothetical protein IPJ54_10105 [Saprospiraceae bacterium]|nr:hypothetical protein [Saprospiraceae bacterium]